MKNNFELDDFQKKAISFTKTNHSCIVTAPTGAGKTVIAEHVMQNCIEKNQGVVYTAPIKALSNQKYRDFSKKYPKNVGILTGDVSINSKAPIVIMTTEIFRNVILTDPQRVKNIKWVIFDEIHYLDDIERGTVWEETIILLPKHIHILALSATLPNIDEFVKWLESVHVHKIKKIVEEKRPVPLSLKFQYNNQIFDNINNAPGFNKKIKDHYSLPEYIKPNRLKSLVKDLKNKDRLPCIYFCFSRRRCEDLAYELSGHSFISKEESSQLTETFNLLVQNFGLGKDPSTNFLYPLIKGGIAFHHAGLLPTLKEIIERLFTTGLIKIIFTTETFALGVNMPARTVVFDAMYKYYGRDYHYLRTRDFYQMAGRAGRRGIDSQGFVYSKINPVHISYNSLEKILEGNYEPIRSQFKSCYATILNLYKTMGETIYEIYPKSFHFHQARSLAKKEALTLLKQKIKLLKLFGYIVDERLTQKAELASKVYSFELQIGELFAKNILSSFNSLTLFINICALVYEPRKGPKRVFLSKETRKQKRFFKKFILPIHRMERKHYISPLSKKFYFNLSEAARAWYEGAQFHKLEKYCNCDEGEIVRYFRMSIQVLRELYSSEIINPEIKSVISKTISRINRDVIDAEKQLRQEL